MKNVEIKDETYNVLIKLAKVSNTSINELVEISILTFLYANIELIKEEDKNANKGGK